MPIPVLAAIAIAGAVGTTASNIHSTRSAARTNRESIAAQRESEAEASRLEAEAQRQEAVRQERELALARERDAATERARQESTAFDRERWNSYMEASRPQWEMSGRIFNNLIDLAGGGSSQGGSRGSGASMPLVAGQGAPPPEGGMPPSGPSGQAGEQTLMGLARATRPASHRPKPFPIVAATQQRGGMSLMDLARLASGGGSGGSSRLNVPIPGVNV